MSATEGAVSPVQIAMYSRLSTDSVLAARTLTAETPVVYVYNDVPEGANYPHVLISRPQQYPKHCFGGAVLGLGWKVIARAHVYSRYQGDKEVAWIMGRIIALLNFQDIAVVGFTHASWECEEDLILIEAPEKIETRHGVVQCCVEVRQ